MVSPATLLLVQCACAVAVCEKKEAGTSAVHEPHRGLATPTHPPTPPLPPTPSPSASENWVNMSTSLASHASGSSSAAVQNTQYMQHIEAVTRDMPGDSAKSVQNAWNTKRWRQGHIRRKRRNEYDARHAPATWFASVHLWFFHLLLLDGQVVHRAGFLGHHGGILRRRGWRLLGLFLGWWWRWVQLLWLGRRRWWVVLLVVLRRWWRDAIRVPLRLHTRFFPLLILVLRLLPVHLAVPLPILPILLPVLRRLVRRRELRGILRQRQLRGHGL